MIVKKFGSYKILNSGGLITVSMFTVSSSLRSPFFLPSLFFPSRNIKDMFEVKYV